MSTRAGHRDGGGAVIGVVAAPVVAEPVDLEAEVQ
jgi:hypothetical protein